MGEEKSIYLLYLTFEHISFLVLSKRVAPTYILCCGAANEFQQATEMNNPTLEKKWW